MTLQDLFLTPFYLLLIYGVMFSLRNSIQDKVMKSYFIPAFHLKIFGAIAFGLIYQFYYGGGDTFNFFNDSKVIWRAFLESPILAFRIIFVHAGDLSPDLYRYTSQIYFFSAGDINTYNVIRVAGFFNLFTFNTYTVTALFFAIISFSGAWALYRALYDYLPILHRPLAYAIFFMPSVYFWGSGLLKESICMGMLGWMFHAFYFGLIKGEKTLNHILILLLCVFVLRSIKVYFLISFLPAAFMWYFLQYRSRIKSPAVRAIALPFVLAISFIVGIFGVRYVTADQERYQLENLAQTTNTTAQWLKQVSDKEGGSGYYLGELDGSILGYLRLAPQALWLGLFQPHPWQARNPVMLLSAFEATFFLLLTLRIIWQVGFLRLYRIFLENPILIFCLLFSLFFAYAAAVNSANYGTMVRYRMPMLPFYLAMLYIIRYRVNGSVKLY